jgi:hypothetical protein
VAAGDHGVDGRAVLAQPGVAIGASKWLVHGVERRECVVDLGHQDRVELQDAGMARGMGASGRIEWIDAPVNIDL